MVVRLGADSTNPDPLALSAVCILQKLCFLASGNTLARSYGQNQPLGGQAVPKRGLLSGCKLRGPVARFALRWESQFTPVCVGTKRIHCPIDEILVCDYGMVVVRFDEKG